MQALLNEHVARWRTATPKGGRMIELQVRDIGSASNSVWELRFLYAEPPHDILAKVKLPAKLVDAAKTWRPADGPKRYQEIERFIESFAKKLGAMSSEDALSIISGLEDADITDVVKRFQ